MGEKDLFHDQSAKIPRLFMIHASKQTAPEEQPVMRLLKALI